MGAAEERDALLAVNLLPIDSQEYFRYALKATLSKNQYQNNRFNEDYTEFWGQLSKAVDSKVKDVPSKKDKGSDSKNKQARFDALKDWLNLSPGEEEKQMATYSSLEVLTKKDFKDLSKDEMLLIMSVLQRLARRMAHQKSRLRKVSKQKRRVDIRRAIRLSMRKGGEIQAIVHSEQKEKKLKLVLLCDVSKSMDLYSRFFVHLIYAFQNSHDTIETFVFSTALHRVSEILNNNEFNAAFDILSERVPQWSGGTTIGSCLEDFCMNHGYGMLNGKTIVFILSDGWDTGAPDVMEKAMKKIYKRSRKVIWLNPLAGSKDFSPEVLGMRTALPYIHTLASAHNLQSLKYLIYQIRSGSRLEKQHIYP